MTCCSHVKWGVSFVIILVIFLFYIKPKKPKGKVCDKGKLP